MKKIILSLGLVISTSTYCTIKNFNDIMTTSEKTAQSTFEKHILNSSTPTIVDFYADWCPACNKLSPIFTKIANNSYYENKINFVKVNYDEFKDIAKIQGVRSLPTLCIYKDGLKVETILGNKSEKELKTIIDKYLK